MRRGVCRLYTCMSRTECLVTCRSPRAPVADLAQQLSAFRYYSGWRHLPLQSSLSGALYASATRQAPSDKRPALLATPHTGPAQIRFHQSQRPLHSFLRHFYIPKGVSRGGRMHTARLFRSQLHVLTCRLSFSVAAALCKACSFSRSWLHRASEPPLALLLSALSLRLSSSCAERCSNLSADVVISVCAEAAVLRPSNSICSSPCVCTSYEHCPWPIVCWSYRCGRTAAASACSFHGAHDPARFAACIKHT